MKNVFKKITATFVAATTILASGVFTTAQTVLAYNAGIEAFVTSLYSDCLGRNPDSVGFNDWCSKLANGQITGKQAAYGFFYSPEFISKANRISDSELIDAYYRVFLNRTADAGGKQYWAQRIANTNNDVSILFTGFADSTEFAQKCASYGVTAGAHINVPTTNRTYQPGEDELYLSQGYEIHYIDLGYGNTQKVYVRWFDCSGCASQINSYRVSNGVSGVTYLSDPNDARVQYARIRAIEVAYCFSHMPPVERNEGWFGDRRCPSSGGGEDIYGGHVNKPNGRGQNNAFQAWQASPQHNANMLGDGVVGNMITMASCEIVMPNGSSVDQAHPGYLGATVLLFWQ